MSKLRVGIGVARAGELDEMEDVPVDRRVEADHEVVLWVCAGPPGEGAVVARLAARWPREQDEPTVEADLVEGISLMRALPPGSGPGMLVVVRHHPRYQTRHRPMPDVPEGLVVAASAPESGGAGTEQLRTVVEVDGKEVLPRLRASAQVGLVVFDRGPEEDEVAATVQCGWKGALDRLCARTGVHGDIRVYRAPVATAPRVGVLARLKRLLGLGCA